MAQAAIERAVAPDAPLAVEGEEIKDRQDDPEDPAMADNCIRERRLGNCVHREKGGGCPVIRYGHARHCGPRAWRVKKRPAPDDLPPSRLRWMRRSPRAWSRRGRE